MKTLVHGMRGAGKSTVAASLAMLLRSCKFSDVREHYSFDSRLRKIINMNESGVGKYAYADMKDLAACFKKSSLESAYDGSGVCAKCVIVELDVGREREFADQLCIAGALDHPDIRMMFALFDQRIVVDR